MNDYPYFGYLIEQASTYAGDVDFLIFLVLVIVGVWFLAGRRHLPLLHPSLPSQARSEGRLHYGEGKAPEALDHYPAHRGFGLRPRHYRPFLSRCGMTSSWIAREPGSRNQDHRAAMGMDIPTSGGGRRARHRRRHLQGRRAPCREQQGVTISSWKPPMCCTAFPCRSGG